MRGDTERTCRAKDWIRAGAGCCSAAGIAASAKWTWSSAVSPMRRLRSLSDAELDELERWLEVPGSADFRLGQRNGAACRPNYDTALFRRLRDFHRRRARVSAIAKSPAELLKPGKPLTLAQVADGAEGLVLADLARAIAAGKDAPAISLAVICRDGQRMAALSRALRFLCVPTSRCMEFPAWDCLPYDRVSPNAGGRGAAHDRAVAARARQGPRQAVGAADDGQRRAAARAGARFRGNARAVGRARQRARHGRA